MRKTRLHRRWGCEPYPVRVPQYNHGVRHSTLVASALLLAACSRDIQNSDAIRTGVVDYLQARKAETGLDPNMMTVDVTSVSFQQDQARATVYFRPKNGPQDGGMQMN